MLADGYATQEKEGQIISYDFFDSWGAGGITRSCSYSGFASLTSRAAFYQNQFNRFYFSAHSFRIAVSTSFSLR